MKSKPTSSEERPGEVLPSLAPSFIRVLIPNVVGLVVVLGLTLLIAMVCQGVASTETATQKEIQEILDRATERLRILVRAAEMTVESAERVALTPEVTGATLRSTLERSLAAFEQRPELSYLGIVLPEAGEYGNLERTATGEILLWLFPGTRTDDPVTRNFMLTDKGFVLHEEQPAYDYDPRVRPFYLEALKSQSGAWISAYQWIVHFANSEPLWGLSYVKALRDYTGRLICVIDTDLDLPALNSFLRSLDKEYHSRLQVVELGDIPRLIGDPKAGRVPLPVPAELTPLLEFSGDVFVGRMVLEGERRWVAARRMVLGGGISWLVITSRQAPFIEARLRRQLYQVGGMGLAIALGLLLVSTRMARRFGKPLAELERRVAAIGRHELVAPAAAAFATDEFRETQLLGEALDHMAMAVNQLLEAKEQQAASLVLKGAIFDSTNTAILSLDDQLAVIEWNAAAERLFGLERERILGQTVTDVVFISDNSADWSAILDNTMGSISAFRFVGAQGTFDAELRVAAFKQNDREVRTIFLNDVSERKRADAALSESLARFHAAARATGDVIWDWDLATNAIWWNENFQILFGYAAEEIGPTIEFWGRHLHPDDHERVLAHIHTILTGTEEIWSDEYRFRRKDGSYADLFDRGHILRDESGRGVRMIGAIQDITERKQAEQRIGFLATHDCLTGLPNRELIQDRIAQAIAHTRRTGRQLGLLYLDLDRFKVINDGYGHPFGDAVLKAVAERVGVLVREGDTVSRQGGDEFLILLPDLHNAADAYIIAKKIVESLDCPIVVQDRKVHLSVSIGASVFPQDGETADALIDNADVAMYRAKDLGRNTCQFFTREMSEETQRRVNLETQLRSAVAARQLQLVYQPKVSLESDGITGCEALLRWHHPELGMVSPAHFIPIAEDSGLIVPIGDWVLRTACMQAKSWSNAGLPPVCVAVNISARQFLQQDVVSWVMRTLRETDLPPAQLELELTESLLAQDVSKVIATFSQLRGIGVKLSIDDFGTGYTSLSYLKRFRVDTLKIDQSFVRDMLIDPEDATIVLAVIALAHNLGFKVIAEGVETAAHCRFLRRNGCDELQGYYFSKPLLAAEFEVILRNGKRLH